jgi:hypothetical protein
MKVGVQMRMVFFIVLGITSLLNADFLRKSNGIVVDTQTKLEWQDSYAKNGDKVVLMKWDEAKAYCDALDLGGKTDWRLPNVEALSSIADISRVDPAVADGFIKTVSLAYWTSTENESDKKEALTIFFDYAYESTSSKNETQYVRCVRG